LVMGFLLHVYIESGPHYGEMISQQSYYTPYQLNYFDNNTRASPYNKKRAIQSRSPLPVRQDTFPVDDTTTKTNLHRIPELSNSATIQSAKCLMHPHLSYLRILGAVSAHIRVKQWKQHTSCIPISISNTCRLKAKKPDNNTSPIQFRHRTLSFSISRS